MLCGSSPHSQFGCQSTPGPIDTACFFMDREFYGLAQPDSEHHLRANGHELEHFLDYIQKRMAKTQSIQEPFAWVDQTPKNCIAAREFLTWRPNAHFIHLIRDGRDVMLSLARRWAQEAPGHPAGTYLGAAAARWTYDVTQASTSDFPARLPGKFATKTWFNAHYKPESNPRTLGSPTHHSRRHRAPPKPECNIGWRPFSWREKTKLGCPTWATHSSHWGRKVAI